MRLTGSLILIGSVSLFSLAANEVDTVKAPQAALNIVKVFNTSRNLWLYRRTESDEFEVVDGNWKIGFLERCIFFKKINISMSNYYFWHRTEWNGSRLSSLWMGTFVENGEKQPLSMLVSDLEEEHPTPFMNMTLRYTERGNHSCSVFSVRRFDCEIEEENCEMYIRNNNGSIEPTKGCTESFNSICRNRTSYLIYEESCQRTGKNQIKGVLKRKRQ
uniref:Putative lipocalin-3 1 n=1 Tax=Amblyomma cajennense TaxID=34607 RepID=A0A023FDW6_AMBCJ